MCTVELDFLQYICVEDISSLCKGSSRTDLESGSDDVVGLEGGDADVEDPEEDEHARGDCFHRLKDKVKSDRRYQGAGQKTTRY